VIKLQRNESFGVACKNHLITLAMGYLLPMIFSRDGVIALNLIFEAIFLRDRG
jgi:hypothetical protein